MHFPTTTACISSLLLLTASASTPASFEVPGPVPGTADPPKVTTTTVFETSTYYLTSAMTLTSTTLNNSTATASSSGGYALPPAITPSLYASGSQTFVPVTLWEGNSTVAQNSTVMPTPIPTGHANGTSSVVLTTASAATTSETNTSATATTSANASASASVIEVPVNGAGKGAENAVLGLCVLAGLMAFL